MKTVVNHRLGFKVGNTSEELAKAFQDRSKYAAGSYTGGQFPYHFVGWPDGSVDQSLSIKDTGYHARKWNWSSIGIAWMGDFREHAPTLAQVSSAIELNYILCLSWGSPSVYGHTELPRSSSDLDKECPGEFFPMRYIRQMVKEMLEAKGDYKPDQIDLASYGIVV